MNAVAYLRVSGISQVTGDGFDRQAETIQQCAAAHGYELVMEFREEAVPGKTEADHRPAFQAMLSWMAANDCKTIICERLDRLARLYRIQEELILEIAAKGFALIAADTGEDITEAMMGDPMRKALVQIQGIFAELAKSMDVLKMRKAMQRIRAEGRRPGHKNYSPDPVLNKRCEGALPFGSKPGEQETLQEIHRLRIAGAGPNYIAQYLNEHGYRSRAGLRMWHPGTISKILRRTKAA